jgi:glycosyltransferase involved in cell wall biosynthesis
VPKKVIVTIYSHPEFYPPTLNLISELSKNFEFVHILSRNLVNSNWIYPENSNLKTSGKKMDIRFSEKLPLTRKVFVFFKYTLDLYRIVTEHQPDLLVLCDPIPTLSFKLVSPFLPRKIKIWYHNHDVLELKKVKPLSISWFSKFSEKIIFKKLALFTLPNIERKKYFPLSSFKGSFYVLPNYPSKDFYSKFRGAEYSSEKIRLIFQGEIAEGHGLESVINILDIKVRNKDLELILVGRVSTNYRNNLLNIAKAKNVENKVVFIDFVSYSELPKITETCQIGIAFYLNSDVMNQTISGASNKIYEYAALKLPVLTNSSNPSLLNLKKFEWCVFSDLDKEKLISNISFIDQSYYKLSKEAYLSFLDSLNFQIQYEKIVY